MTILRIDDILRQKGMTERQLAQRLGVSYQSVNSVVRCRVNSTMKNLARYANALNVPIGELFEEI